MFIEAFQTSLYIIRGASINALFGIKNLAVLHYERLMYAKDGRLERTIIMHGDLGTCVWEFGMWERVCGDRGCGNVYVWEGGCGQRKVRYLTFKC